MKQDAILFIDIDESPSARYSYREPHFAQARSRGLACLIAAVSGRDYLERLEQDSDELFLLEALREEAILDLVKELEGRYSVRAIFCHAGHASAQGQVGCIVARVCRQLGLVYACPDAIAACNNKFLMRQVLHRHGLRSVPFALCNNHQELEEGAARIGYPLIVKPAFGGASAFIRKCSNWSELSSHYTHFLAHHGEASCADFYGCAHVLPDDDGLARDYIPGQSILLEGYISGVEGTVECAIIGERVHPVLINEKLLLTERSGTVLENLLITPPASFTAGECDEIRRYAIDCLRAIGLTNALVHFEFRLTELGPIVIEINPRLGGLYVNAALRDLAKLDPYQLYISVLLGEQVRDAELEAAAKQAADCAQSYSMLAIYPQESGFFKGFAGVDYLQGHDAVVEYAVQEPGSHIDADIEEHYLLKCWVKVDGAAQAHSLHDAVMHNLSAIIDKRHAG
ncbi:MULTISPECIES: ATP-grasp domain-containing protein [unclassified Pseudomonas]|uniref:ATP-grasp domain-containing protein n=1 Tax=unclassified Pseudomonas TaxID=196821 RepID=UPI001A9D6105|nr:MULTISPECIES: ATP-grasp domain-containing protein [unclassified Pseudomonas]